MRGSKRRVIVVDSRVSVLRMTEFISRTSRRESAQKAASSSSLSNFGMSAQRVISFTSVFRFGGGEFCSVALFGVLSLVEGHFFRSHFAREDHAILFPVRPEQGEDRTIAH